MLRVCVQVCMHACVGVGMCLYAGKTRTKKNIKKGKKKRFGAFLIGEVCGDMETMEDDVV